MHVEFRRFFPTKKTTHPKTATARFLGKGFKKLRGWLELPCWLNEGCVPGKNDSCVYPVGPFFCEKQRIFGDEKWLLYRHFKKNSHLRPVPRMLGWELPSMWRGKSSQTGGSLTPPAVARTWTCFKPTHKSGHVKKKQSLLFFFETYINIISYKFCNYHKLTVFLGELVFSDGLPFWKAPQFSTGVFSQFSTLKVPETRCLLLVDPCPWGRWREMSYLRIHPTNLAGFIVKLYSPN